MTGYKKDKILASGQFKVQATKKFVIYTNTGIQYFRAIKPKKVKMA
jgi:hypothetical protein